MAKTKVLFLCVHNSARSQMAEAFLKKYGDDRFFVESAGFDPGALNLLAVTVMAEAGIDISGNAVNSVFEFFKQGKRYDYVITVCDESNAERCPVFPGITRRLHWSFADPSAFSGSPEEKLAKTRVVRDNIAEKIIEFIKQLDVY